MKNSSIILFLIFITTINIAQPLRFGVRLDAFALHTEKLETGTNYVNKYTVFFPRAGYLFFKGSLNEIAKIDAILRVGYLDANDYSGFELGMFLDKYIFNKVYLLLGFTVHFNRQMENNQYNRYDISHSKPINLLNAGIGYDLTAHFFFELNLDYALNNEYGFSHFNTNIEKPKNVYNIIRLGLGYKI